MRPMSYFNESCNLTDWLARVILITKVPSCLSSRHQLYTAAHTGISPRAPPLPSVCGQLQTRHNKLETENGSHRGKDRPHLFVAELHDVMFQIYGMQLSAPCRIVEMTAEVLGLEYEFKVVDPTWPASMARMTASTLRTWRPDTRWTKDCSLTWAHFTR